MEKEIKIEKKKSSFAARKGERQVGELTFTLHPERMHLDLLRVEKEFRKRGIAKALIAEAIGHARSIGKKKITAHVEGIEDPQLNSFLLRRDKRTKYVKLSDTNIDEIISYFESVHPDEDIKDILQRHANELKKVKDIKNLGILVNWPSERTLESHGFRFVRRLPTEDHDTENPKRYIIIGSDGRIKERDKPSSGGVELPALAVTFFRFLYEKDLSGKE